MELTAILSKAKYLARAAKDMGNAPYCDYAASNCEPGYEIELYTTIIDRERLKLVSEELLVMIESYEKSSPSPDVATTGGRANSSPMKGRQTKAQGASGSETGIA